MAKTSFVNAWKETNKLLWTHKFSIALLSLLVAIQTVVIGLLSFADPIVIVDREVGEDYQVGQRKPLNISEQAVKKFVKQFLRARYEWPEIDPVLIHKNIAPIATDGLKRKIIKQLSHLKDNELKGKSAQQAIVNIEIDVQKDKVVAKFDKLVKIDNIPLPIPTSVALNIIKAEPTKWNPIGLYVNGIMEYQKK